MCLTKIISFILVKNPKFKKMAFFTCDKCAKKYKSEGWLTRHKNEAMHHNDWDDDDNGPLNLYADPDSSYLKCVLTSKNRAPAYVTNRRGYRYETPVDLIANKDDPELLIPESRARFKWVSDIAETRRETLSWLLRLSKTKYFSEEYSIDKTFTGKYPYEYLPIFCLAVELLDRTLATLSNLNGTYLTLLATVCLWIAGKIHVDWLEIHNINAATIAGIIDYDEQVILNAESLILTRLNWNVSSRYTVPWFVDYLGEFTKNGAADIVGCHIDGSYRFEDPYTIAERIVSLNVL